jgi:hypothetical protein
MIPSVCPNLIHPPVRFFLLCLLLGLAGCITIEPLHEAHVLHSRELPATPHTYDIVDSGPRSGVVQTHGVGMFSNDDGRRTEYRTDIVERTIRFVREGLDEELQGIGWQREELTSELLVHFGHEENAYSSMEGSESRFSLRIAIVDRKSGEVLYSAAGIYRINEVANRPIVRQMVASLLEPIRSSPARQSGAAGQ